MATQLRSAQTRDRIRAVAADLFIRNGYLETDVKVITHAADLTPGAFYYHFASKEALVVEIIAEGWSRIWNLIIGRLEAAEPGLENVIAASLAQAELLTTDEFVWVAIQLNLACGHLSVDGRRDLQRQYDRFIDTVAKNIRPSDIRADVEPADVGQLIWILLQGSSQLPVSGPPFGPAHSQIPQAVKNWKFLLRAIVPPESLPRFEEALMREAAKHS